MTEREHDVVLAVIQSDLALAGLILVFAGFLIAKSDTYETKRGDKYRYLSLFSGIPIASAIASAWACVCVLEGWQSPVSILGSFKVVLGLTSAYILLAGWMLKP
jgi:hypothetical protein